LFATGTDVRLVSDKGKLIGQLTIDPTRNYQPMKRV
jgi:hypothetical protein